MIVLNTSFPKLCIFWTVLDGFSYSLGNCYLRCSNSYMHDKGGQALHAPILHILALCLIGFNAHAACLPYEPASVTLSGTLERKTFPGSPNYESVANGDEPETGFYLALSTPICAVGTADSENPETHRNVKLVQLILDQQGYSNLHALLGKKIHVRGSLFSWVNGHHHTPLLLSWKPAK